MDKGTEVTFDILFSNASMGILVTNEQGIIVLANPFLLSQFQYTASELLGAPLAKLIPSRFHHRHSSHVANYHTHPKSRPMGLGMDLFAVKKNGDEFPVEVSLGNFETQKGKFVIAYVSDISLRKKAEEELKHLNEELEEKIAERTSSLTSTVKQLAELITQTEAKDVELRRVNIFLHNVWEHAGAIIFATDPAGTITLFNPSAELHLGYKANEIIQHTSPVIFHQEQQLKQTARTLSAEAGLSIAPDFAVYQQIAQTNQPKEFEFTYVRKDHSTFPVSLNITAMRNKEGCIEGYLGIAIDITERKKAETDLRLALHKEIELSELKSRFVSIASHEFRTPLSTVLSSAYLISKYTESSDHAKRQKHVQRIISSVNLLTDILNDFLSVGKIEEGKIIVRPASFQVKEHIQNIVSELNGLMKKGQKIVYTHEGCTELTMDATMLKHIVLNLLSNAIKFSPEKTIIQLASKQNQTGFCLTCRDEGLGISEEDQQHLFERFFRGSNVSNIQGTGLGLHIISKYTELMNGTIFCKSKLNEGTTFEIHFAIQPC
ncbi:PAS domain S-box-containing protein [Filimonas lacunae]|uniref:histidine kinase n=1 Tax=Filimonas lacunae TaxID=477680 RepID=A0A173MGY7_9BACT|nr:PAS domain-containing sensor histidine kinase [Filimonas lacunae]BAV06855.1 two-component sensor histidine kinase [Filimonas lacunae]SIS98789.1 PAS domain S-box-containing protein [Filimonas lacunae]